MQSSIDEVKSLIDTFSINNAEDLEQFRIKFLGSKNVIKDLFEVFKTLGPDDKKIFGVKLNELKQTAQEKFDQFKTTANQTQNKQVFSDDYTKPGIESFAGSRHPISLIKERIVSIFEQIGFTVANGPEIEDDWHNFSALNFPPEHPARDMQDTFFVSDDLALRTHTSSVQVRVMESERPPIRKLMPGRVYRNEAVSSRSHCMFHQIEGLYIDKNVSFADLKATLDYFAKSLFGAQTEIRLRPSYFPFTEPSAEMDIYWGLNNEVDYRITKGTGWLEVMGCGMVDPQVLENCGIDSSIYSGYAFGLGLERIALHQYKIPDLRIFFENDMRFLKQFQGIL